MAELTNPNQVQSLVGKINIDQTRGVIQFKDDSGNVIIEMGRIKVDPQGNEIFAISMFDENGVERLRVGDLPDDTINFVISKDGVEVEDAF